MALKFTQTGNVRGDCTAPYAVELDKEYTVGQLIDVILTRAGILREWGYIGIYDGESIFGNPKCEYADARLGNGNMPSEFLAKKVIKVEADGGWSRMDFMLWVE